MPTSRPDPARRSSSLPALVFALLLAPVACADACLDPAVVETGTYGNTILYLFDGKPPNDVFVHKPASDLVLTVLRDRGEVRVQFVRDGKRVEERWRCATSEMLPSGANAGDDSGGKATDDAGG